MIELPVLTAISATAAGALVAAMWEGLVLAGCVALALRLMPRIAAAARSVVWLATMGLVCALPFLHGGNASGSGAPQLYIDGRWSLGLVAVWGVASLYRAAELVRSAVYLRGISRRARQADCVIPPPQERGEGAPGRLVPVCVSDEVDRPSVVGFFAPKVLIPRDLLAELTAGELEQVLLHEMEHLRRGDDWTNLAQKLALVVFPLNPALVWIERQLCLERELACDDRVLQVTGARKAYAACLANLAEHRLVQRGLSLALGAWGRRPELVRRVHRILAGSKGDMPRGRSRLVVAGLLCGVLMGGDLLAHGPRLVSFVVPAVEARNTGSVEAHPFQNRNGWGTEGVTRPVGVVPVGAKYGDSGFARMTSGGMTSGGMASAGMTSGGMTSAGITRVKKVVHRPKPVVAREIAYHQAGPRRAAEEPMMVVVTWQVGSRTTNGAAAQSLQFRYAAVPTGDGWLFVQL